MSNETRVILRGKISRDGEGEGEARTYPITLSSETPVAGRFSDREVLSHAEGAIDIPAQGIKVKASHDPDGLPVGLVRSPRVVEKRLVGRVGFGSNYQHLARDVEEGLITDVSIEAYVDPAAWQERGDDYVASRWRPGAVALVTNGADPASAISRGETMSTENSAPDGGATVDRNKAIADIFAGLEGAEWLQMRVEAYDSSEDVEVVRSRVMAKLKGEASAVDRSAPGHVQAGADQCDKWVDAAEKTLMLRANLVDEDNREEYERAASESDVGSMSLREMSRDYLRVRSLNVRGSMEQIIQRAFEVPAVVRNAFAHSTSDFSQILAAVSDKALGTGYTENEETYSVWCRNKTMSNFQQHSFPVLSTFSDLEKIGEGGELKFGSFTDKAEVATLAEYGKGFSIGRKAIVNDNLNAFTDIPSYMGRAAARLVGDLVYGVLTTNAAMNEDGNALFFARTAATQAGTNIGTGGAISTTTLGEARKLLRLMRAPFPGDGSKGARLNTTPRFLIVPAALEEAADGVLASTFDPQEGSTTSFMRENTWKRRVDLIVEPRLDDDSATAWYMAAGRNAGVETVVIGWLNGVQRPRFAADSGFDITGRKMKVELDVTAWAGDFRGMIYNAGA